jgi:hypothetical protein
MHTSLFNTFKSPYHAVSLKSTRYKKLIKYVIGVLVILPLLFFVFQSLGVFLAIHIAILILFPVFIWIYLLTDKISDVKLDVIKVCVIMCIYFTYLVSITWLTLKLFNPELKKEFVTMSLGYIILLTIISIIVIVTFFYHRYAQAIIKRKSH